MGGTRQRRMPEARLLQSGCEAEGAVIVHFPPGLEGSSGCGFGQRLCTAAWPFFEVIQPSFPPPHLPPRRRVGSSLLQWERLYSTAWNLNLSVSKIKRRIIWRCGAEGGGEGPAYVVGKAGHEKHRSLPPPRLSFLSLYFAALLKTTSEEFRFLCGAHKNQRERSRRPCWGLFADTLFHLRSTTSPTQGGTNHNTESPPS